MGDAGPWVEREDVAAAVSWLCSDDARGITGQVIRIG
jgi:enoyl-[acyl-carrier-protein] reductase (NADH)